MRIRSLVCLVLPILFAATWFAGCGDSEPEPAPAPPAATPDQPNPGPPTAADTSAPKLPAR